MSVAIAIRRAIGRWHAKTWGVCLSDPICSPGESEACDGNAWRSCGLADDGSPQWNECVEDGGDEGEDTPLVLVFPGDELAFERAVAATSCSARVRCSAAVRVRSTASRRSPSWMRTAMA